MPENTMNQITVSPLPAVSRGSILSRENSSDISNVTPPALHARDGQITATSLQVAAHFGKLHKNVIRAIQNLEIPDDYRRLNFELTINRVPGPKGAFRDEPMYHISRDGFALLAMGFTGKEAMRWKVAYISTFNAMEAKLRALYVSPLLSQNEFRSGIKLQTKLKLMEQSRTTMHALVQETCPHAKENLYFQLRYVNDALGIPTASSKRLLGQDAPDLTLWEGRAR